MRTGLAVILHPAPLVQHGLKSILLSAGVGILEILPACPGPDTLSGWSEVLILADASLAASLLPFTRSLRKNGNTLAGISFDEPGREAETVFDTVLRFDSTVGRFREMINSYMAGISPSGAENQLSARETEVLVMVAQGCSNRQIGEKLFISIHTVISHRKNITAKLGIKSISGLTLYAAMNNLVDYRG